MKIHQARWAGAEGWSAIPDASSPPDLVIVFGGRVELSSGEPLEALARRYPKDRIFGCSTAGEIDGSTVRDGSLVATAVWLDRSKVRHAQVGLGEVGGAEEAGRVLASRVPHEGLSHVLVFSDGTLVNGSELVRGLVAALPTGCTLSGGLSGDGASFGQTVVVHEGQVSSASISLLAFYGFDVGVGSLGGWDPFGPDRTVTKSKGNVVYEFDGEPALALYRRYLGPYADELPSSGLRFPVLVQAPGSDESVVRTLLAVSAEEQSLTFAGDVPEGSTAQLMRANFDRLVTGAQQAAQVSRGAHEPELAILISCVGRKLVLQQRIEEEVEAVREVLGATVPVTGFYSYGELAPFSTGAPCRLHNQTMTVTTLREAA
ncbi:MAG: FIST N-terminal domain-containing protein [Myxococcaceae bacterium]